MGYVTDNCHKRALAATKTLMSKWGLAENIFAPITAATFNFQIPHIFASGRRQGANVGA